MSEQKKGVTVKTPENLHEGVNHEGASAVWITDGHLHAGVHNSMEKRPIAIYAPGQWISAVVNK